MLACLICIERFEDFYFTSFELDSRDSTVAGVVQTERLPAHVCSMIHALYVFGYKFPIPQDTHDRRLAQWSPRGHANCLTLSWNVNVLCMQVFQWFMVLGENDS